MSTPQYAPREDRQQLAWAARSAFNPEAMTRAGRSPLESCPAGFGISPQLPTEAVELSGDVSRGLSQ
jgi:hypothetical protein